MTMRTARHHGYQAPKIDGPQAVANAQMLLSGARDLSAVTIAMLRGYRLSEKMATYMLQVEQGRRGNGGS